MPKLTRAPYRSLHPFCQVKAPRTAGAREAGRRTGSHRDVRNCSDGQRPPSRTARARTTSSCRIRTHWDVAVAGAGTKPRVTTGDATWRRTALRKRERRLSAELPSRVSWSLRHGGGTPDTAEFASSGSRRAAAAARTAAPGRQHGWRNAPPTPPLLVLRRGRARPCGCGGARTRQHRGSRSLQRGAPAPGMARNAPDVPACKPSRGPA